MKERIHKIIADQLGVSPEKVVADSRLVDDLGADSLDTVELTMKLETEFGIEIPDQDQQRHIGASSTVQDVVSYMEGRLE